MSVRILQGDVRDMLATLPDESVHCVVTSPPYWGLRDYGVDGQIGMEPTMGEHIDTMVDVFREVRRVMRKDATCWLNYGDCYATSPNGRSAADTKAVGNDDRTFRDKPFSTIGPIYDPDYRERTTGGIHAERRPDSGGRIVAGGMLKAKDLCMMPNRLAIALQEPYHLGPIKAEIDRAWLAGLIDADGCIGIRRENNGKWNPGYIPYLTVGCSDRLLLERCVEITGLGKVNIKSRAGSTDSRGINQRRDGLVWRLDGQIASRVIRDIYPYLVQKWPQARVCNAMNVTQGEARTARNKPVAPDIVAYRDRLYELIKSLNQREDVILPALPEVKSNVEQGWWIRSEIIWNKPNPMPESITDRPATAHEKIWLLTKSARYFYDAEAVRRPIAPGSIDRYAQDIDSQEGSHRANGGAKTNGTMKAVGGPQMDKQRGHGRRNDRWDAMDKTEQQANGANLRNVWTIPTKGFSGWVPTIKRVYVARDDPSGDKRCIPSPGCPAHGGLIALAAMELCDGHEDGQHLDSENIDDHPERGLVDGSGTTRQKRGGSTSRQNSDLPDLLHALSATDRSNESRRTARDPETSQPDKPSSGNPGHTADTSAAPSSSGQDIDIGESNTVADEWADNPDSQKSGRTAGTEPQPESCEASVSPECTCKWYIEKEEQTSHFATFPPDLIVPCIKAGTSEKGCCAECGAPWVRETTRIDQGWNGARYGERAVAATGGAKTGGTAKSTLGSSGGKLTGKVATQGWLPSCACDAASVPCTVLDPFIGSGTTAMVADRLGRDCIGIDLNPANVEMSVGRIQDDAGMFAEVS